MPRPPAAVTSSAVSSMVSGRPGVGCRPRVRRRELRPVQYTVPPASPRATAMPRPAPRVAPATSAILPVNSFATLPVDILASLPGDTLRTAMSLMGEGVAGGADVEGVRVDDGRGGGDVGLRDAVLPGEMVLVPEGPEVAEHHRCAGEHVAEAAPQELARVGERAVEADDGEAAKLHSRSGSRKSGEQEKILRIEQVEGSAI